MYYYALKKNYFSKLYFAHSRYFLESDRPSQTTNGIFFLLLNK